ncbi:hypothetical protein [Streptomyces sp. NPDC005438]|uniref:hypothetical protein n=1 Tax=Streptomyces sp. NPDC005438 TaxID=3156880 RepID=UPI0033BE5E6B
MSAPTGRLQAPYHQLSRPDGGRERVQLLYATDPRHLAVLRAAVETGALPQAPRRRLLLSTSAPAPEVGWPPGWPAPGEWEAEWGRALSLHEALHPLHPAGWEPREEELPLWERYLRLLWGLGEDRVELVTGPLEEAGSRALARVFPDAPLWVCADGLRGHAPSGLRHPPALGARVRGLYQPDLLPGLEPLLLREFAVPARALPVADCRAVWSRLAGRSELPDTPPDVALLLDGADPEALTALGRLGHTRVLVPAPAGERLARRATEAGCALVPYEPTLPLERLLLWAAPALVVGPPGVATLTAAAWGFPVARSGGAPDPVTSALLGDCLPPLPESTASPWRAPEAARLSPLRDAVAYCRHPHAPVMLPPLRPATEQFLRGPRAAELRRLVPARRLVRLGLNSGGALGLTARLANHRTIRRWARRLPHPKH